MLILLVLLLLMFGGGWYGYNSWGLGGGLGISSLIFIILVILLVTGRLR